MPGSAIRFAAGTPKRPRSSVWRLWTRGSETYLGMRSLLGNFKVSLHSSGKWVGEFIRRPRTRVEGTTSLGRYEWKRPSEFAPGWTRGPAVLLPWVEWRDDFRSQEPLPTDVEWVRGPNRNKKLEFDILFSAPRVTPDELVSQSGGRILGQGLPLRNGETVWLHVKQAVIPPDQNTWLDAEQRKFQVHYKGDPKALALPWVVLIMDSSLQGVPLFVHFALGRRHLTPTASA